MVASDPRFASAIVDIMFVLFNIVDVKPNEVYIMSYRERVAWVGCISTVLIWGGYLAAIIVHTASGGGHPSLGFFWLFVGLVGLQAGLGAAVGIATAIAAPRDAKAPVDERDRLIAGRAGLVAYRVVLVGMFAVIAAMHGLLDGIMAIFALFGVVATGEAVRYGAQVIGYRHSSHG